MAEGDNLDQIARFLTSKGLTPAQVAGIAGNFYVESGFRTDAYNAGEGAIGIAQWRGGRRQALERYAASIGRSPNSLAAQLGYLWQELTGSEAAAYAKLQATNTPAQAAAVFDQYFERSSGAHRDDRITKATEIYKMITQPGWKDGNPADWTDTSGTAGPSNIPTDYDPDTDTYTRDDPYEQPSLASQLASSLFGGVKGAVFKIVFALGGLTVIAVGLAQAVKPAATRAKDAAVTVIDTAKAVKP